MFAQMFAASFDADPACKAREQPHGLTTTHVIAVPTFVHTHSTL